MRGVAVFTNIPTPYNGFLFSALRRDGWDLRVVYKGDPQSEGRPWTIPLGEGDVIAGTLVAEAREVRRCRTEGRTAIVSGHYHALIDMERRALLGRSDAPTLFWGERFGPAGPAKHLVRRAFFSGFDAILAVGSWATASYRGVAPSAPVHVLPYTTAGPRDGADRALGSRPVVGYVGGLIRRKGVDILLRAVAGVPVGERPLVEIAGSGPLEADLRELAHALGVDVRWLGEADLAEVERVRRRWWVQAVPSRYDGWGVVVAEALSAGVPVVSWDRVGAARDLIRGGCNGTLVAPGRSWTAALRAALDVGAVERQGPCAVASARAFSADAAAAWLGRLLDGGVASEPSRSFVEDAWAAVDC